MECTRSVLLFILLQIVCSRSEHSSDVIFGIAYDAIWYTPREHEISWQICETVETGAHVCTNHPVCTWICAVISFWSRNRSFSKNSFCKQSFLYCVFFHFHISSRFLFFFYCFVWLHSAIVTWNIQTQAASVAHTQSPFMHIIFFRLIKFIFRSEHAYTMLVHIKNVNKYIDRYIWMRCALLPWKQHKYLRA